MKYQVGKRRKLTNLHALVPLLKAGDIVEVDGDATYPGGFSFNNSGTPAKKITIRGIRVRGKRPVLFGSISTAANAIVQFLGSHYLFEGFEITAGSDPYAKRGIRNVGNDITIRDCCIHDTPEGVLGSDLSGSLTLSRVEIYRCGGATGMHQIYVASNNKVYPNAVFRMEFCHIHNGTAGCNLKTRVTRNEIYYNWIEDAAGHEMDLLGADRFHQDPGLEKIIREDSDIVGNVFVKSGYSPVGCIARMGSDGTGVGEGRYRWLHNTIILRRDYPLDRSVFRVQDAVESIEFHNNVIHHCAGKPVRVLTDWKLFEGVAYRVHGSNNCLPRGSTNVPKDLRNTVFTDNPKFADADKFDFTPRAESPLIGAAGKAEHPKDFPAFHRPLAAPKFSPPPRSLVAFKPTPRTARDIGAIPFTKASRPEVPFHTVFVPPIAVTTSSEIHCAAEDGDLDRVRALLKQDPALANARFEERTPLTATAVDGHVEIVKLLLAHGAEVNGRDGAGCTALFGAAFRGHTEIARILLEHGAQVNAQSKHGQTPLFTAAQFNRHPRVVQLLLQHGADINLADRECWTPLHAAVATGLIEVIATLLEHGANVNAQNSWGQTPVHLAVIYNRADVLKLLLARNPDLTRRTAENKTPLELARQLEAKAIAAFLKNHRAAN